MNPLSLPQLEKNLEGKGEVDSDAAIDLSLPKLPRALLVEIQEHGIRQRSQQTHFNASVLAEIEQSRKQEHRNEILDIVCNILKNADSVNVNCNFISSIKKSKTLKVDNSKLCTLSLEDGDEQDQDGRNEEEKVAEPTATPTRERASIAQDSPKKVWFNPRTSIEFTISREDMTEDEKKQYWLQDEEFDLIRMRDGYLGNLVEQRYREKHGDIQIDSFAVMPSSIAISPQNWICTRGLECKMKFGFLRTKDRRLTCLENVIMEQEHQWDEHWNDGRNESPFFYDWEAIARVSLGISTQCKIHAQSVATSDRSEVDEILREIEADEECKE